MTIISRLLNKFKPQPKTLAQKTAEIPELSQQELTALFSSEEESEALKAAAISALDYSQLLTDTAFNGSSSSLQQKAKARIAQLIDSGSVNLEQFSEGGFDVIAQLSVIGFCTQKDLLQQFINNSTEPQLLYQVAGEGVSVKLRELAVEKIDDEILLKHLLKETKGKDKSIYKIVKAKCDQFKERDRQAVELQTEILNLCERLEAHGKRPFDKIFSATTHSLKDKWLLLAAASPADIALRAQAALEQALQTIDQVTQEQLQAEADQLAVAHAGKVQQGIISELRLVLASLYQLDNFDDLQQQSIQTTVTACQQRWNNSEQHKAAVAADKKKYAQVVDGIGFQLQQLTEHGSFSQQSAELDALLKASNQAQEQALNTLQQALNNRMQSAKLLIAESMPQTVIDCRALLNDRNKQQADKKSAEQNLLRHISALIRKAENAIASGQSRHAAGIRRSIEEKLSELAAIPSSLSKQLEQMDVSLSKLLDWKNYAVAPKKQQLIEQMQGLINSQEKPDALATKIKRLQDEWKSLSQGAQDQALWETFHQLAQTAYEPCKAYFEAEAEIRKTNLEQRKSLVVQLQDYYSKQNWGSEDSNSVDWIAVQTIIATAVKEWHSYSPTERNGNKPVEQDFDQSLNRIREKLNAHQQQNYLAKQQLIEQAQKLIALDDNRKAVDAVKGLQAQWQSIGFSSRKDDQKLWGNFRASCDAIFDKRQQQTIKLKAELNTNKDQARVMQAEVEQLCLLTGQELVAANARLKELQQAFNELGALPKASAQQIKQDFYNAIDRFESTLTEHKQTAKEQIWHDLLTASNHIRLAQLADSHEEKQRLQVEAKAYIDSIEQWPKNGLAVLEQKIAQGTNTNTQSNHQENELALKTLCIRAEILGEKATPEEDKALRMAYQVKQLQKGLRQKSTDRRAEMNALIVDWVAVGPVDTGVYLPLLERFKQWRDS